LLNNAIFGKLRQQPAQENVRARRRPQRSGRERSRLVSPAAALAAASRTVKSTNWSEASSCKSTLE